MRGLRGGLGEGVSWGVDDVVLWDGPSTAALRRKQAA